MPGDTSGEEFGKCGSMISPFGSRRSKFRTSSNMMWILFTNSSSNDTEPTFRVSFNIWWTLRSFSFQNSNRLCKNSVASGVEIEDTSVRTISSFSRVFSLLMSELFWTAAPLGCVSHHCLGERKLPQSYQQRYGRQAGRFRTSSYGGAGGRLGSKSPFPRCGVCRGMVPRPAPEDVYAERARDAYRTKPCRDRSWGSVPLKCQWSLQARANRGHLGFVP